VIQDEGHSLPEQSSQKSDTSQARAGLGGSIPLPDVSGANLPQLARDLRDTRAYIGYMLVRMDELIALIDRTEGPATPPAIAGKGPVEATTEAERHGLIQALRESRTQVIFGIVAGIVAIVIALYLFAGSR